MRIIRLVLALALFGPAYDISAQCLNCPVSTNAFGDADVLNGYLVSTRQLGNTRGGAVYLKNFNVFGNRGTFSMSSQNHDGAEGFFQLRSVDSAAGPKNLIQAYSFGYTRFPGGHVTVEGGNLGVGQFNLGAPGQMFELYKDDADVAMRFQDPGDVWYTAGISNANGRKFFINRGPNAGANPDFVIDNASGHVGIGTTVTPDALNVAGAVTVGPLRVIDATGKWVGDPTGLVGPQGPQGAQGAQGPQGPAGPPIGTVAICGSACNSCAPGWQAAAIANHGPCTAVASSGSCSHTGSEYCADPGGGGWGICIVCWKTQ
jgi:hypothetical protein